MKQLILSAALVAASLNAAAEEPSLKILGVHAASVHSEGNWNNFNPGLYAQFSDGRVIGTYYNSERGVSVYAGKNYTLAATSQETLALEATVGVMLGYKAMPVAPFAVPSVRLALGEGKHARLTLLPTKLIDKKMPNVLHLSLEQHF